MNGNFNFPEEVSQCLGFVLLLGKQNQLDGFYGIG
jgi:hypothetical protein